MATTANPPANNTRPAAKAGAALAPVSDAEWKGRASRQTLEKLSPFVEAKLAQGLPATMRGQEKRLIRCLITECGKTPALMDCSPLSLYAGCIQAGQLGLTIGGPQGEAYLIPFKGAATLVVGYKGFIQLAYRTGMVMNITPRVVRDGDVFEVRYGTEQGIRHIPKMDGPTGDATHFYATVKLTNGGGDFEVMSLAQVMAHKEQYALSAKGPWGGSKNDFEGMALKTVVRRLAKRLPLSVDFSTAVGLDNAAERGEPQNLAALYAPELTGKPAPMPEEAAYLEEQLDRAGGGKGGGLYGDDTKLPD